MKEGAGDIAPPAAGRSERAAFRVGKLGERRVVSRLGQGCLVELVAAHNFARPPDRTVTEKTRLAIAEVEPALCKARGMSKQGCHAVARTIGIFEPLAKDHETPAFA